MVSGRRPAGHFTPMRRRADMTSACILALTGKPRGNSMIQGQRQVPADGLHGPARPVRSLRTLWRQAQLTARHGL
jgi:hypothetical protein